MCAHTQCSAQDMRSVSSFLAELQLLATWHLCWGPLTLGSGMLLKGRKRP